MRPALRLHLPGQHNQAHHGRESASVPSYPPALGAALVVSGGLGLVIARHRSRFGVHISAFSPSLRHHFTANGRFREYLSASAQESIRRGESQIRHNMVETMQVYDQQGRLLGEYAGDATNVRIPAQDVRRLFREVGVWQRLTGRGRRIVTHNHTDNTPLSMVDLRSAARLNVQELRAVTPDGTVYRLVRPDGGWPDWNDIDSFAAIKHPESLPQIARGEKTRRQLDELFGVRRLTKGEFTRAENFLLRKQNVWLLKEYLKTFGGVLLIEKGAVV
jgi:hypothetical protein